MIFIDIIYNKNIFITKHFASRKDLFNNIKNIKFEYKDKKVTGIIVYEGKVIKEKVKEDILFTIDTKEAFEYTLTNRLITEINKYYYNN